MHDHQERMRIIVKQALAEAAIQHGGALLREIHLDLYEGLTEEDVRALFSEASLNTPAHDVLLTIHLVGTRYICWNCCGLRFEGGSSTCPNCGEEALRVPDEIAFALRQIIIAF